MGIDLSTASRQVRALEDRGLVERSGDPDDQRTRWLNLTDTGHHALEDARALRIEVLRRRLTAWNPLEVAELARLLEMFIASFDESSPADQQRGTDKNCDDAVQGTQSRIRRAAPTLSGVGGNLT
jgi:predicted MarR family transcription regulator